MPSFTKPQPLKAALKIGLYGPAGGGYGSPLERDPQKVADDVLDGVISVETALKDYGVVVSAKGVVDYPATAKARTAR